MPNNLRAWPTVRRPRRHVCCAGVLVLLVAGCVSLHRNPVAQNVIDSRQLSLRGIDARQQGAWSEAEKLFGEAIELCPTDELAHQRYADSLWHRGSRDDAIIHMEKAVRLSGGDASLLVQLGQMYLSRGRTDKAREQVEAAIRAQPQGETAWAVRGDVLVQQGQLEEAMMSYHRALGLRPHYPGVQLALSNLYLWQDRPRRALATVDSLANAYPPDAVPPPALALKGIALKRIGRYQAAIEVLTRAAEGGPPSADLLSELAEAQWLSGDSSSAQVVLRAALSQAPRNRLALRLSERMKN